MAVMEILYRLKVSEEIFLTDLNEISNLNTGPSINASFQASVHLANSGFRGKDFLDIDQPETRNS
jgi:hypothetical protein